MAMPMGSFERNAFTSRKIAGAAAWISDAAYQVLEEEKMLNGYESSAHDQMEKAQEEMELMMPVLENEKMLDAFKEEADYYLYHKKSLSEVAESVITRWEHDIQR